MGDGRMDKCKNIIHKVQKFNEKKNPHFLQHLPQQKNPPKKPSPDTITFPPAATLNSPAIILLVSVWPPLNPSIWIKT